MRLHKVPSTATTAQAWNHFSNTDTRHELDVSNFFAPNKAVIETKVEETTY
jgi:hypothetical protein